MTASRTTPHLTKSKHSPDFFRTQLIVWIRFVCRFKVVGTCALSVLHVCLDTNNTHNRSL